MIGDPPAGRGLAPDRARDPRTVPDRPRSWIATEVGQTLAGAAPLVQRVLVYGVTAAILAAGALAVRLLTVATPFIGGVDFYYYVVTARDLAEGAPDMSPFRYFYFPGVYSFWQLVFRVSDGSLAALQWAYAVVLAANALLTGMILARLTAVWQAGVLAMAAYLFQAGRIEGFAGSPEPIATLPFLAGVWLWIVLGRAGRIRAGLLALGCGFGCALYVRQQSGLLALGAIALLPVLWAPGSPHRCRLSHWLILPFASVAVFLVAMGLEGGGLEAVKTGLAAVHIYRSSGSWMYYAPRLYEATAPISTLFFAGCALWAAAMVARRRASWTAHPAMPAFGLSVLSAAACLLQFWKRPYQHYALLALPSAIIVAGLTIHFVVEGLGRFARRSPRTAVPLIVAGAVAFMWLNFAGTARFVKDSAAQLASPTRWTTNEEARVFAPLCAAMKPRESLLMIPPRENQVHWLCGTRPTDLRFIAWEPTDPERYIPLLSAPSLNNVFVLAENRGYYERRYFEQGDWPGFFRAMDRLGFRQQVSFKEGRLFRRMPP